MPTFAENTAELLFVWIRISAIVPALREAFTNPEYLGNMETVATAMIEERQRKGSYETFRKRVLER